MLSEREGVPGELSPSVPGLPWVPCLSSQVVRGGSEGAALFEAQCLGRGAQFLCVTAAELSSGVHTERAVLSAICTQSIHSHTLPS